MAWAAWPVIVATMCGKHMDLLAPPETPPEPGTLQGPSEPCPDRQCREQEHAPVL